MSLAKRLEKCARRSVGNAGWGTRHFLTLSIPRAAYPVPCPAVPADLATRLGTPNGFGGFTRDHGDGTITKVRFETVCSEGGPRTNRRAGDPVPLCIEPDDGWGRPMIRWIECSAWTGTATADSIGRPDDAILHDAESPEWRWLIDVATARSAAHQWNDTARRLDWCSEDIRCLFGECEFWAKTTYHADDARCYGVAFAVKPWYVARFALHAARLALHAARLSRALRSEGIDARWRGLSR